MVNLLRRNVVRLSGVCTDPQILEETEAEKKYWTDSADKVGERLRVKMRIVRNLLRSPLTKEIIKNTSELKELSILKQPQGTNFPITPEEWNKIKLLIEK